MLRSSPFHPNMQFKLKLEHFHTSRWTRPRHSPAVNTLETVQNVSVHNLYFCSYNFHISRFSRSGTCKGEVNVYRLCPNMVQITVLFLSRSLVTPRYRCVIMKKVVNESLRNICHYQQNVPQHYYLLDTLVFKIFLSKS